MKPIEYYYLYFAGKKMRNVFLAFEVKPNEEIEKWIHKSKFELNHCVNLILILDKLQNTCYDDDVIRAILKSIASYMTSVVVNLFDIFNIFFELEGTDCVLQGDLVYKYIWQHYFVESDDIPYLNMDWFNETVTIDAHYIYLDAKLIIANVKGEICFQIMNTETMKPQMKNPFSSKEIMIPSLKFFLLHLLNLLRSIDLVAKYAHQKDNAQENYKEFFSDAKTNLHIPIDKIMELVLTYQKAFEFRY